MDRTQAGGASKRNRRPREQSARERDDARGSVHSFVEVSELRRIMGRLTAIEMLRLLLLGETAPYGA